MKFVDRNMLFVPGLNTQHSLANSLYLRSILFTFEQQIVGNLFKIGGEDAAFNVYDENKRDKNRMWILNSGEIFFVAQCIDRNRMLQILFEGQLGYVTAKILAYSDLVK